MPRRILEDHKEFIDIVSGKLRQDLKKLISSGDIFKTTPSGKIRMKIPKINIPFIVFGDNDGGIGRGKGQKGDVIGKTNSPADDGNQAGDEEGDSVLVEVNMETILAFMKDELKLPNLKPKENDVFEEKKIRYRDISLHGPESLRHNRRTLLQAIRRSSASGDIKEIEIPGFTDTMKSVRIINSDKRYRQYKEYNIPASNAVIFFARDGSGSMNEEKCDLVSKTSWWIETWIRHFYKRVDCVYVWHDVYAEEVDQNTFYRRRFGGGTICSSALKLISSQIDVKYDPAKWNIYVLYFTDGENMEDDNAEFVKTIEEKFTPNNVNLFGLVQTLAYNYNGSLRKYVDDNISPRENIKTTGYNSTNSIEYKKVITDLLGVNAQNKPQEKEING